MNPTYPAARIDAAKCAFYKEFYQSNRALFKTDPSEYHHQARVFVENKMLAWQLQDCPNVFISEPHRRHWFRRKTK